MNNAYGRGKQREHQRDGKTKTNDATPSSLFRSSPFCPSNPSEALSLVTLSNDTVLLSLVPTGAL